MARRIESYYLWFKEDVSLLQRFAFFEELYNKILYKDDKWHFFTEGSYDELRFDSKFKRRVERFINTDKRIDCITPRKDGWQDDQEIVEIYKEYFTEIFHQNTLLSLNIFANTSYIEEKTLKSIMDRVVHSFFNMIHLFKQDNSLEIKVMREYLTDRAFYTGYLFGIYKEKKRHE